MASRGYVTVFEAMIVLDDGGGPAEDGSRIVRSRSRADLERQIAGHRIGYNGNGKIDSVEVPRRLAQRWGLA